MPYTFTMVGFRDKQMFVKENEKDKNVHTGWWGTPRPNKSQDPGKGMERSTHGGPIYKKLELILYTSNHLIHDPQV